MSDTKRKLILITAILNTVLVTLYCIVALSLVFFGDIYISGEPDNTFSTFYYFIALLSYALVPVCTVVISTTIILYSNYLQTDVNTVSPLISLIAFHSGFAMVSSLIYNYAGIVLGICFAVIYTAALFPIEDKKTKTILLTGKTKSQKIKVLNQPLTQNKSKPKEKEESTNSPIQQNTAEENIFSEEHQKQSPEKRKAKNNNKFTQTTTQSKEKSHKVKASKEKAFSKWTDKTEKTKSSANSVNTDENKEANNSKKKTANKKPENKTETTTQNKTEIKEETQKTAFAPSTKTISTNKEKRKETDSTTKTSLTEKTIPAKKTSKNKKQNQTDKIANIKNSPDLLQSNLLIKNKNITIKKVKATTKNAKK